MEKVKPVIIAGAGLADLTAAINLTLSVFTIEFLTKFLNSVRMEIDLVKYQNMVL